MTISEIRDRLFAWALPTTLADVIALRDALTVWIDSALSAGPSAGETPSHHVSADASDHQQLADTLSLDAVESGCSQTTRLQDAITDTTPVQVTDAEQTSNWFFTTTVAGFESTYKLTDEEQTELRVSLIEKGWSVGQNSMGIAYRVEVAR